MIKKLLTIFLILIFVGGIAVYFFGSMLLSKGIKAGVETFGPQITQTPVTLEDVKLSILSGNGKLSGLNVGNPEGFSSENIFALGQIEVDTESSSLFSDEIVINKIYIKEPLISYEKTLKTSNLKELLKNIEESTGSGETTEVEEPPADAVAADGEAPGKNVLIKEFVIENPKVFLGIVGLGTTVSLPSIELTNISSSKEKIAATILKQVIEKIADNIKDATKSAANVTTDVTKEVFDTVKSQTEEPLNQVNEGIKNLFGK
jgi:hypothetical protein